MPQNKWPYDKKNTLQHLGFHFIYQAEMTYLPIFILSLYFSKNILIIFSKHKIAQNKDYIPSLPCSSIVMWLSSGYKK